ncbi:hypothetical protein HYH02_003746 [Chlamydomonas schloesseri]|uniref:FHA domain-containing protein n=1 Tax=Chlamydomonas schloesseri TaxID=2026947 RepID=A0A836BAC8_9CHLO|nr:hypothetical protein HYH02_003746 [Chlamydomonas schloesseri]|eukprot:KAG2451974.1 hypothetical protein HYH02_003746 [Chlamydomonas schloesseri]
MGRNSKNSTLDLILGESTTISRQHASIRYNFEKKQFELVVLGKNGVSVDHGDGNFRLYTPESPPTALKSRDLLMLGEKKFYFLLPRTLGSRKRRRAEASPAPAAVAPAAAAPAPGVAAPALPTAGVAVPAAAPAAAPVAAPVAALPHTAPQAAPAAVAPPAPQAAPAAAAVHPGAAYPAQEPAAPQPGYQAKAPPLPTQAAAQPPQPGAAAAAPPPAAQPEPADEEEALINAGGPMQYDNGAEYGAGFGGGF